MAISHSRESFNRTASFGPAFPIRKGRRGKCGQRYGQSLRLIVHLHGNLSLGYFSLVPDFGNKSQSGNSTRESIFCFSAIYSFLLLDFLSRLSPFYGRGF